MHVRQEQLDRGHGRLVEPRSSGGCSGTHGVRSRGRRHESCPHHSSGIHTLGVGGRRSSSQSRSSSTKGQRPRGYANADRIARPSRKEKRRERGSHRLPPSVMHQPLVVRRWPCQREDPSGDTSKVSVTRPSTRRSARTIRPHPNVGVRTRRPHRGRQSTCPLPTGFRGSVRAQSRHSEEAIRAGPARTVGRPATQGGRPIVIHRHFSRVHLAVADALLTVGGNRRAGSRRGDDQGELKEVDPRAAALAVARMTMEAATLAGGRG